ncbi:hypothetical protein MTO96_040661 [Rhipicephalus appendiculatus]
MVASADVVGTGKTSIHFEKASTITKNVCPRNGPPEVNVKPRPGSLRKRPWCLLHRLGSMMLSLARSAALHIVCNVIVNARPPDMASGNHLALLDTRVAGMKHAKYLGLQFSWNHNS